MTERVGHLLTQLLSDFNNTLGTLVVDLRLPTKGIRFIVLLGDHGITRRKLIYTGGAVSHVLSGNIYGHFDVKLEFHHLKWSGVPVSEEITDETSVSSRRFSPISIRDS